MKSRGIPVSKSPTMKHPKGSSAATVAPLGTGHPSTRSKHKLHTSAPENAKTLGRSTPGALK